ncbi:MAG: PQQ-dependent sugar dehydrogenase [Caulobacterales bacterium]
MLKKILIGAGIVVAAIVAFVLLALSAPTLTIALHPRPDQSSVHVPEPMEAPGTRYFVDPKLLPPPMMDPDTYNSSALLERTDETKLRLPEGFEASIFAEGLDAPRWMTLAPNGDVFLTESSAGKVIVLRDTNNDGRADREETYAEGFDLPHGMAFHGDYFYVADVKGVWRFPYRAGDVKGGERQMITPPGAFGVADNHWTRNILFSPDGSTFLVTIGSRGNLRLELEPSATLQQFNADGSGMTTYARGLRNPVGLAYYPGTRNLFVTAVERDQRGDRVAPDFFTQVERNDFFGWPFAYAGRHFEPRFGFLRPDLVLSTKTPDVLIEAHSVPLGLMFYDRDQFPEEYRGDAFIAMHGSWNRTSPSGYMIARVRFENGRPVGGYEVFASGFWVSGQNPANIIGRPVALLIAPDGSLLVSDDAANVVWRISYKGSAGRP